MEVTLEQFEKVKAENEFLHGRIKILNDKVAYLLKQLFGSKSEKISPDQLPLLFAQAEAEVVAEERMQAEEVTDQRTKRTPRAERIPDHLPVEQVVIEPEEVLADPAAYQRIGEEITVELDVVPAKFFKREIIRPKYVKRLDRQQPPVIAPAPKRVIENSFASVGLLVMILLGKYSDHLPLYRQEQIFKVRYGVALSRKTMCDWVWQIAHQLAMIYEALRDEIRKTGYVQADETPVSYQDPGNGKCGQGYLWTYRAQGQGVLFEWFASRASDCLTSMLATFSGQLQTDGYAGYDAFFKKAGSQTIRDRVELAACWAHVRRKFYDAREESPLAVRILADIQGLYRIEEELREQAASVSQRQSVRQEKSLPILSKIENELRTAHARHLPQSLTGKAISYALELWDRLLVYTRHGHMEIDNNLIENAIRPTAIGKKNWLFFGSAEAGQSSAIIYSLLESCRMLKINPQEYLLDILPRLPTMTNQTARLYTPAKWKAARNPPAG